MRVPNYPQIETEYLVLQKTTTLCVSLRRTAAVPNKIKSNRTASSSDDHSDLGKKIQGKASCALEATDVMID